MIKLLLKHMIADACLTTFFDGLNKNFQKVTKKLEEYYIDDDGLLLMVCNGVEYGFDLDYGIWYDLETDEEYVGGIGIDQIECLLYDLGRQMQQEMQQEMDGIYDPFGGKVNKGFA